MARSRNIKPGFFKNDILAEIEPLGRLLFAGLWILADREGRLGDRPKRIKVEVLPYDDCDINALLDQLVNKGFIVRYKVEGHGYIQVLNFKRHQNPHKNEIDSIIPPPEPIGESTDKIQSSTDKIGSTRADSLNLIPDSLNNNNNHNTREEGTIFQKFEQEFGRPLSPMEYDKIKDLEKSHVPELVAEALGRAVVNGKPNMRYIETILVNWEKSNIRSMAEVKQQDIEFEQRKQKGGKSRGRDSPPAKKPDADYANWSRPRE